MDPNMPDNYSIFDDLGTRTGGRTNTYHPRCHTVGEPNEEQDD